MMQKMDILYFSNKTWRIAKHTLHSTVSGGVRPVAIVWPQSQGYPIKVNPLALNKTGAVFITKSYRNQVGAKCEPDEVVHQRVISGERYDAKSLLHAVKLLSKGTLGRIGINKLLLPLRFSRFALSCGFCSSTFSADR